MSKKQAEQVELPNQIHKAIVQWAKLVVELDSMQAKEKELRLQIAKAAVPTPKEGVNRVVFKDQDDKTWELVYNHKVNRSVDVSSLDAVMSQLPPDSVARNVGTVIKYTPSLVSEGYKSLPEAERLIVAQAITEKDGMPQLEINEVVAAMQPDTAPPVPDWPAQLPTIEANGIHYAPHPKRTYVGEWYEVARTMPETVSLQIVHNVDPLDKLAIQVLWNGVPVDPLTGDACQRIDTPLMDQYQAEKRADIDRARAYQDKLLGGASTGTGQAETVETETKPKRKRKKA